METSSKEEKAFANAFFDMTIVQTIKGDPESEMEKIPHKDGTRQGKRK